MDQNVVFLLLQNGDFSVQIEGLVVEGPNMNQNNVIVLEFRVGYFDSVELCPDLVFFAFPCQL